MTIHTNGSEFKTVPISVFSNFKAALYIDRLKFQMSIHDGQAMLTRKSY